MSAASGVSRAGWWAGAALVGAIVLGCAGFGGSSGSNTPAPPPAVTEPAPPAVAPAAPAAAPEVVLPAAVPVPEAPTREQAVTAYLAECNHVLPAAVTPEEAMSDPTDECLWMEFDQNCGEDPSGCWDRGQRCESDCGPTCTGCQAPCVATCDTCKAACAGDAACLRTCAEHRADCRDTCLTAKSACATVTCPAEESKCYADFEAKVAKTCPHCAELGDCMTAAMSDMAHYDEGREACKKKLPEDPAECWDWCFQGW